jgi:hypothetical protein
VHTIGCAATTITTTPVNENWEQRRYDVATAVPAINSTDTVRPSRLCSTKAPRRVLVLFTSTTSTSTVCSSEAGHREVEVSIPRVLVMMLVSKSSPRPLRAAFAFAIHSFGCSHGE